MTRRGFERVSKYEKAGINIPRRATQASAGYDFEAAETVTVPSLWRQLAETDALSALAKGADALPKGETTADDVDVAFPSTLVPTGIKAFMPESEVLLLVNRSSGPMKRQLALPNGIGVIDADYYNNPKNEGEIYVQLINYGLTDYVIKKGDRIAQGIFVPYGTMHDEVSPADIRTGGFGSSGH